MVLFYEWSKDKHWLEQLKPKRSVLASMDDFVDYGRQLITIAERLIAFEPHCCLGPLRGASFPCSLAAVTTNAYAVFDFFDYRAGSQPKNYQRVNSELRTIVAKRNPGCAVFRVAVVDTSISGHGINALVGILKSIREDISHYRKQRWELQIHLLHDSRGGQRFRSFRV